MIRWSGVAAVVAACALILALPNGWAGERKDPKASPPASSAQAESSSSEPKQLEVPFAAQAQIFDTRMQRTMGGAQLLRWLNVFGQVNLGHAIYYDPEDPYAGREKDFHIEASLQPNSKLNESVSYDRVLFDRASNGARVFTVDIINTKTTYQFNKQFSLRAIARYDSSQKRVLTDYLASFELVPGTVAYAGYGGLYEEQERDGTRFIGGQGGYLNTRRGLFFKLSYLYRF